LISEHFQNIYLLIKIKIKTKHFFLATDGQFNGVRDVFKHLMKTEGIRAMYKGAVPVMLRAFPANACCFMGYEFAMSNLCRYAPDL
jgi:solute carrier family 25 carnitine/acylcarnitine transporter 20/29